MAKPGTALQPTRGAMACSVPAVGRWKYSHNSRAVPERTAIFLALSGVRRAAGKSPAGGAADIAKVGEFGSLREATGSSAEAIEFSTLRSSVR